MQKMKTIVLYGLRRSGNHFVISNILNQFKNSVHINDCRNFSFDQYQKYKNIRITQHRTDNGFTGFHGCDCLIISIESAKIDYKELDKFKNLGEFYPFLLLRNPYHNIASAWKEYTQNGKPKTNLYAQRFNEVIQLWPYYAEEYLKNKIHTILYDEYVNSLEYRNSVLEKLEIQSISTETPKKITFQKSSFADKSKVAKTYGGLKDSVFYGEPNFMNIFNDSSFELLWDKIVKPK